MNFEDLTPEQQEKLKSAKTPEDILAIAKEEGYALSEDELAGIAGGRSWFDEYPCEDYHVCETKAFCSTNY